MSITMNTSMKIPKTDSDEIAALQRMEEWTKMSMEKVKVKKQITEKVHLDTNWRIFVTGFSLDTTCDMLETFFSQYGKVVNVYIPFDCQANSKGFGFIDFDSLKDHQTVLAKGNFEFNNRTMVVRQAFKRRHGDTQVGIKAIHRNFGIYVGFLPKRTKRSDIISYFTQFGKVENVFQHDPKSLYDSKMDFCCVTFDEEKSVRKVLDQKCHKLLDKVIVVKTYSNKHVQEAKENVKVAPKNKNMLDFVDSTRKPEHLEPCHKVAELMKNLASKEKATLANSNWGRYFRATSQEITALTSEVDEILE